MKRAEMAGWLEVGDGTRGSELPRKWCRFQADEYGAFYNVDAPSWIIGPDTVLSTCGLWSEKTGGRLLWSPWLDMGTPEPGAHRVKVVLGRGAMVLRLTPEIGE